MHESRLESAAALLEYRRRQEAKIRKWVSKEILEHRLFIGSMLFQELAFATSRERVNELIQAKVNTYARLDDLTVSEKELWHLLDKHLREQQGEE